MYSLKKFKQIKWKCTLKTFLFNVIMIKTVSYISEPCVKNAHPHTYPPNTLVALAKAIQRYLRENNRPEINFMQKKSPVFPIFQLKLMLR